MRPSADAKVRGRFSETRRGPAHRCARSASAALENFVRHPQKTFSTVSTRNGHGARGNAAPGRRTAPAWLTVRLPLVNGPFTFGGISRNSSRICKARGAWLLHAMAISVSAIDPAESSKRRRGNDSADRSDRAAQLALKAFMSMNRAVAIVGPDGKLLQPNLVFEKLFGGTDIIERVNRDAGANNGKT